MPRLTDKEIDDAIVAASYDDGLDSVDESGYDEDWREDAPRPMYAVLTMQRVVKEVSMEEWVKYFTTSPRRMAYTNVSGVIVSTTFLGINLGFITPLWFESMVFGGGLDGFCERYATLEEAIEGHQTIVTTIKEAMRDAVRAAPRVERERRNNVVR